MAIVALEVVSLESGEVVSAVNIRPGNDPERVMLRNMDTDRFCVREVEAPAQAEES
jgi:hypothetical protein